MLPSTNNVCKRWKHDSLCLKSEAVSSRAQYSPLDRIHDENASSTGPQVCGNESVCGKTQCGKSKNLN